MHLKDNSLENTLAFFQAAIPDPSEKNRRIQLGVHFEEVAEMLDTLRCLDASTAILVDEASDSLRVLSDALKTGEAKVHIPPDARQDFLDALCDQIVTATGCGLMFDLDIIGALDEVNRSNLSKFDADGNPIFDENGKITKGPNYSAPNLKLFV